MNYFLLPKINNNIDNIIMESDHTNNVYISITLHNYFKII